MERTTDTEKGFLNQMTLDPDAMRYLQGRNFNVAVTPRNERAKSATNIGQKRTHHA